MMKKLGVWVINAVIVFVVAWVIGQLTGGSEQAATGNDSTISVNLSGMSFLIWIVALVVYFYGAKKLWGKTVGGLIMNKVLPTR